MSVFHQWFCRKFRAAPEPGRSARSMETFQSRTAIRMQKSGQMPFCHSCFLPNCPTTWRETEKRQNKENRNYR